MTEWYDMLRLVWIVGGVVAINEPGPDVAVRAGAGGAILCTLRLNAYPDLFADLRKQGFPIVGATFVRTPEELDGLQPPEFRAANPQGGWGVWEATQQWRQIAHAAGKNNQMLLMDIASRIASGLRYSQLRLHDLVTAYSTQLRGHLHTSEAKDYAAFNDGNSFGVFKAIHALFWQMAVLRDNLAEFAAKFCFGQAKISTFSSLLKALRSMACNDPLAAEFLRAGDPAISGWVATFTSYRNCFTHVAPMEQAANLAFAIQDFRTAANNLQIPQIYYPLPQDVDELVRKRTKGPLFGSLRELATASTRRHQRSSEPDALEYLHHCLTQFAHLAVQLLARSPIPPQPITITKADIIGELRISR